MVFKYFIYEYYVIIHIGRGVSPQPRNSCTHRLKAGIASSSHTHCLQFIASKRLIQRPYQTYNTFGQCCYVTSVCAAGGMRMATSRSLRVVGWRIIAFRFKVLHCSQMIFVYTYIYRRSSLNAYDVPACIPHPGHTYYYRGFYTDVVPAY